MLIETVYKGIRYTLSNEDIQLGDKVYPIGRGRCLDNGGWILHKLDFSELMSGFPDNPHTVLDLKHSSYKPYEVRTNMGYSPAESYFKIIKREQQIRIREESFGGYTQWVEILD